MSLPPTAERCGLQVAGGGTITFDEDTDAGVERYFAYAKGAGMPLIVATGAPALMRRVERFARRDACWRERALVVRACFWR